MSKRIRKHPVHFLKVGSAIVLIIIFFLMIAVTSCKICPLTQVFRTTRESIESAIIEGSGEYTTEDRQIGTVNEVALTTIGEMTSSR